MIAIVIKTAMKLPKARLTTQPAVLFGTEVGALSLSSVCGRSGVFSEDSLVDLLREGPIL
jgi:hypothetical protein